MYSEEQKAKMKAFIGKLTVNPCFVNETSMAIEENIILFLLQNENALKSTFTSQAFFPTLQWKQITELFLESLSETIDSNLTKDLSTIVQKKINLNFVNILIGRQVTVDRFQEQLLTFMKQLLTRFETRRAFEPVLKILNFNIIDRYIENVFVGRGYIARQLQILEKVKLDPAMVADYVKFIMLISIVGNIRHDMNDLSLQQKMSSKDSKYANIAAQKVYYDSLYKQNVNQLGYFPPDLLQKAFFSHLSYMDDINIPATSRLVKIFTAFGRYYKPNTKVEKGAESFEKSWFQTQRKNYKFFGFDLDMIEELYRIAAGNYW